MNAEDLYPGMNLPTDQAGPEVAPVTPAVLPALPSTVPQASPYTLADLGIDPSQDMQSPASMIPDLPYTSAPTDAGGGNAPTWLMALAGVSDALRPAHSAPGAGAFQSLMAGVAAGQAQAEKKAAAEEARRQRANQQALQAAYWKASLADRSDARQLTYKRVMANAKNISLTRLITSRANLMGTKGFGANSPVIQGLDDAIADLQAIHSTGGFNPIEDTPNAPAPAATNGVAPAPLVTAPDGWDPMTWSGLSPVAQAKIWSDVAKQKTADMLAGMTPPPPGQPTGKIGLTQAQIQALLDKHAVTGNPDYQLGMIEAPGVKNDNTRRRTLDISEDNAARDKAAKAKAELDAANLELSTAKTRAAQSIALANLEIRQKNYDLAYSKYKNPMPAKGRKPSTAERNEAQIDKSNVDPNTWETFKALGIAPGPQAMATYDYYKKDGLITVGGDGVPTLNRDHPSYPFFMQKQKAWKRGELKWVNGKEVPVQKKDAVTRNVIKQAGKLKPAPRKTGNSRVDAL